MYVGLLAAIGDLVTVMVRMAPMNNDADDNALLCCKHLLKYVFVICTVFLV
jgi:hypothetical protein